MSCCGNSPRVYIDGRWSCAECGGLTELDTQLDFSDVYNRFGYKPKAPKETDCECGSDSTYGKGSNTHATWCPLYKK